MLRPGNPRNERDGSTDAGQPRPTKNARRPSAAERVRTLVESSVAATLTIPGSCGGPPKLPGEDTVTSRAVDAHGTVFLQVPAAHPAAAEAAGGHHDLPAVMEITDVAPVAVPRRVRGRAAVAGWLTPVPEAERQTATRLLGARGMPGSTGSPGSPGSIGFGLGEPPAGDGSVLLRLEVGEAHTDDLWGTGDVEPEEFAAAVADPLAHHEAELLQHLAGAHAEQVQGLTALLTAHDHPVSASCAAGGRLVPLALDRFGMRLRSCGPRACPDVRFAFEEPVCDLVELRRAMHRLFEAAAR